MTFITNLEELRAKFAPNVAMIGDLPIDVVKRSQPIYEYEVTQAPVEEGANISDHRKARPVGLSMDCIFTDPDFSASAVGQARLNGTFSVDSWLDKKRKLDAIKDSSEVVTVVTEFETYESMVLTRVSVDRTASTSNAVFVSLQFMDIRIVSSAVTDVDPSQIPKRKKKKKTTDQNEKEKDLKSKDAKGKKSKSILKKGSELLASVFS
jgi:hypothetical protein